MFNANNSEANFVRVQLSYLHGPPGASPYGTSKQPHMNVPPSIVVYFLDNEHSTLMPFKISEVIEMSQILRDVILGLIVFMYPDIKLYNRQWHTLCQVSV